MCGIMGFYEKNGTADAKYIINMMSTLKHRGPDDQGYEIVGLPSEKNNCALGFVRLSIRELSQAGHQPMWNAKHTICITFNGEIYNADSFREELVNKGCRFRGTSDTEVLLYLYEIYGIDSTLEKIDGMYAFAIYDEEAKKVILARDRIGEKPLYYYENKDVFLWASEYKAFYCHPSFVPELSNENITEYLMYRYISNGETLLNHVKNICPGHYLVLSENGYKDVEYWNISNVNTKGNCFIDRDLFEKWIKEAVESRLISDVAVGVQLSGGVDSSVITKFASEKMKDNIDIFGIIFDGDAYNEEKYMEQISKICSGNLDKIMLNGSEFLNNWKETTYFYEAPMNHPGTVCLLQLNRRAKSKVSVLLCGEGADETLGGYPRFARYMFYGKHPVLSQLYLMLQRIRNKDFLGVIDGLGYEASFVKETQYGNSTLVNKIYPKANTKQVIKKRREILESNKKCGLRKLLDYEIKSYLQDILMRADKITMAASVELRVPYLMPQLIEKECLVADSRLVSPVFRNMSDCMRATKIVLKEISEKHFGREFTYRDKIGLAVDLKYYFEKAETRNYIENILLPGIKKREILDSNIVNCFWKEMLENKKGKDYNSKVEVLWIALSFEMWCQMYIDRSPALSA